MQYQQVNDVWRAVVSALVAGVVAALATLIANLTNQIDVTTLQGLILSAIVAGLKWVQKIFGATYHGSLLLGTTRDDD